MSDSREDMSLLERVSLLEKEMRMTQLTLEDITAVLKQITDQLTKDYEEKQKK